MAFGDSMCFQTLESSVLKSLSHVVVELTDDNPELQPFCGEPTSCCLWLRRTPTPRQSHYNDSAWSAMGESFVLEEPFFHLSDPNRRHVVGTEGAVIIPFPAVKVRSTALEKEVLTHDAVVVLNFLRRV